MTLRVLHIGKFFPPDPGGMEVYLADLMHAQRAHGLDAHALVHGTPRPDDPAWLVRVPVAARLMHVVPLAPGFRRALAQAIERIEPDVLHLHMPNASALLALTLASARRIPWVVHWHSDVVSSTIRGRIALAYKVYRPFEQALLEQAERIVVTSQDYLAASAPLQRWRNKCTVVPLGLDPARLPEAPTAHVESLWEDGAFRLLSVGRLTYYKGFETLIRAVYRVSGAQLLIVGDGEERPRLAQLIHALTPADEAPRVRLLGALDDDTRSALLASCQLFCLASRERTEAFGVAVLEAMHYGRPCLVSDLHGSGLRALVAHNDAGRLAPVDDVPAWQQALQQFIEQPEARQRHGEAGRAAMPARYHIHATLPAIDTVYRQAGVEVVAHATEFHLQPLIVIPARDEAATIGQVIATLQAGGWQHIVVIDDQSQDRTADIARAAGATVLQPVLPLGAWGAMQAGIRYAVRKGYPQVITIDADGQHEPAHIPDLLAAARSADVVIGAHPERGSPLRRFAWRYFRLITGFRVEDLTSGFRCYNRQACEILADEEATLMDYQDLGVLLLLRHAGLSIAEVPVMMYPRASGPSRIFQSWTRVARYMVETSLLCIARWHPRHHVRKP